MEQHKETDAVLAFDLLYTTNHIQMLKATLPYAPRQMQPMLAVLIKYMELAYTLSCINHPLLSENLCNNEHNSQTESITNLISSLEKYLTNRERQKLASIKDMMRNIEQMKEMQKVMELLQPAGTEASTNNILSNFMPQSEDFNKSNIDQAISQIFSTIDA